VTVDRAAIAYLRHELRTPLNHIIGYGEMLLEEIEESDRRELAPHLRRILEDARDLLGLVNELLAPAETAAGVADPGHLSRVLTPPLNRIFASGEDLKKLAVAAESNDLLPDLERIVLAVEHLLDVLNHGATPPALERAERATGREPAAARTDARRQVHDYGTILVVDDNENNREMLARRLAREGYTRVVAAADGRQALDLLRSRRFDLVLLDIMMPQVNGYQVLEALKSDPERRDVPVIMISAVDELDSAIRCIELGAEDYLLKPFNPTLLRARVGASLEKKRLRDEIMRHVRRMENELETARAIQLSMVPTDFPIPSPERPLELYATLQPAYEVGGDLYDFFWVAPDRLCLVVADVSSKGAPAALYMARAKAVIRLLATELAHAAHDALFSAELLARANEELCRDNPHAMFATLILCLVDARTGEVSWCNAGHNPHYLVVPEGVVTRLAGGCNMPVGIEPTFTRKSETMQLAARGSLFMFTDGITEATNERKELFGSKRLEAALRQHAGRTPREIVTGVLEQVCAFSGKVDQSDDIAALACRWGM
jgi:sigma-B regulation protein RsbU (phosphoserine phosphatase)